MSKTRQVFYLIFAVGIQILQIFTNAAGQDVEVFVDFDGEKPSHVVVASKFTNGFKSRNEKNLPFIREVAGRTNLASRISDVVLSKGGEAVSHRKLMPGEYLADALFDSWKYTVDLSPHQNRIAAAHASWIADNGGILMLDDVLPQFASAGTPVSGRISLNLPPGWTAFSNDRSIGGTTFETENIEKSVIFVGNIFRPIQLDNFSLIMSGEWHFTDDEAAVLVKEILGEYSKLFSGPPAPFQIAIMKFPSAENPGLWEAETRGRTVTILSSDMPFKTQSIQRLHEQLRHELFHLWIPNGVNLGGNYDWFYEGFALYQSLKTGVLLNRIRFEDFLDTLSRAHNIDSRQNPRISLLEASKNRVNGANTQVYARGMLVAFLCDVALLEASKGKTSGSDLLGKLFEKHRPPNPRHEANSTLIELLNSHGLAEIVEKYISGKAEIRWASDLRAAGIEASDAPGRTELTVSAKLNGRQKALLDKLGYNSWRKMSRRSK